LDCKLSLFAGSPESHFEHIVLSDNFDHHTTSSAKRQVRRISAGIPKSVFENTLQSHNRVHCDDTLDLLRGNFSKVLASKIT